MLPEGTLAATEIWKRFRPDKRPLHLRRMLETKRDTGGPRRRKEWHWALRDVTLRLEPGESLGLIGVNGSGKSTLLKILCRVMYPHSGRVDVEGRVGALIEVAAGIHPQLTGRENIFIYGALLGLSRRDTAKRFDEIVEFAEVGHAIDRLIKFYSSGMKMRLGFAVAAFLEPDILLVDEVLSVGDAQFQRRCLTRMREVLEGGTTLVYVSHDLRTVEATCKRAIWLDRGLLREDGPVRDVLTNYNAAIEKQAALDLQGDGDVRVCELGVSTPDGGSPHTGEPLQLRFVVDSLTAADAVVHVGISEGPATPVLHSSRSVALSAGETMVQCRFDDLPLANGRYYVWVGISRGRRDLLAWSPAAQFDVIGPDLDPAPQGVVRLAPVFSATTWKVE
jgi:ABC-type polysaccharide/polyol phosphate transport system ATPase subunit